MKSKMKNIFIILIIALGLSSCALSFHPQTAEDVRVEDNYAIFEHQGMTVAAKFSYWSREPQIVSSYYTVFYLSIKNEKDEKVSVSEGDFFLLDDQRNQLDIVSKNEIAELIKFEQSLEDDMFTPPEERQANWDAYVLSKQNLDKYMFKFGDILPNATKSGYIIFQELDASAKKCNFVFKDKEILFKRKD